MAMRDYNFDGKKVIVTAKNTNSASDTKKTAGENTESQMNKVDNSFGRLMNGFKKSPFITKLFYFDVFVLWPTAFIECVATLGESMIITVIAFSISMLCVSVWFVKGAFEINKGCGIFMLIIVLLSMGIYIFALVFTLGDIIG